MPDLSHPLISICIPAYKRTHYLKRLLESIVCQTYRNYEVILSDDSDDNSVELVAKEYMSRCKILYYKNQPALGTPANWNFAISKAKGEWVKLMHDDDWFATTTALQSFADATGKGNTFIVSGYDVVDDNGNKLPKTPLTAVRKKRILKQPMVLFYKNYIGQPSVTMVHHTAKAVYDERMKWRVDIDYYMQLLFAGKKLSYIPDALINIGVNASQVTNSCLNVPGVELPEGLMLLEKYGTQSLRNILVYDAWWRVIRNTGTTSTDMLYQYASTWPDTIVEMTKLQSRIGSKQLKNGFLSKMYMTFQYLRSFGKL